MSDMREWIETLEESGELIRIKKPVDINTEMGALIWESRDKALLFENIVGYPGWRTLAQGPGTMRQVGISHDAKPGSYVRTSILSPALIDRNLFQAGFFSHPFNFLNRAR